MAGILAHLGLLGRAPHGQIECLGEHQMIREAAAKIGVDQPALRIEADVLFRTFLRAGQPCTAKTSGRNG